MPTVHDVHMLQAQVFCNALRSINTQYTLGGEQAQAALQKLDRML